MKMRRQVVVFIHINNYSEKPAQLWHIIFIMTQIYTIFQLTYAWAFALRHQNNGALKERNRRFVRIKWKAQKG